MGSWARRWGRSFYQGVSVPDEKTYAESDFVSVTVEDGDHKYRLAVAKENLPYVDWNVYLRRAVSEVSRG